LTARMQGANFLVFCVLVVGALANCPGDMELINAKCYLFGVASSREDALAQCKAVDPDNHLWVINHKLEMDQVMEWFSKRLISPWAWTDGIKKPHSSDIWIWESTGARISYKPDAAEGDICDGQCVSPDCATAPMGDCVALSLNDLGSRSYQGCSCAEAGDINFVCESADEIEFSCPGDGLFASAPCSDYFLNCWGGHATPEYCEPGLVFNEEVGYCDFPENVDGC